MSMERQLTPVPRDDNEEATKTLQMTKVIHLAMVAGVLMLGIMIPFITFKDWSFKPDLTNPLVIMSVAACGITLACAFGMRSVSGKFMLAQTAKKSMAQRYQSFCLVRWAVIEGGAMFSGLSALVSSNVSPIVMFCLSAAVMAYFYPSDKELKELTERLTDRFG